MRLNMVRNTLLSTSLNSTDKETVKQIDRGIDGWIRQKDIDEQMDMEGQTELKDKLVHGGKEEPEKRKVDNQRTKELEN